MRWERADRWARAGAAGIVCLLGAGAVLATAAGNLSSLGILLRGGHPLSPASVHAARVSEAAIAALIALAWLAFALRCALRGPPRFAATRGWEIAAAALAVAWGWYFLSGFRTADFGLRPLEALFLAVLAIPAVVPLSWAAVAARPRGRRGVTLLLLACAALAGTELWARAEELVLLQRLGRNPPEDTVVRRWPPFAHHELYFAHGVWHGED